LVKLDEIIVLKSVFYKKGGSHWEHKLFWRNLDHEGRIIFINSELDDFIEDDFNSDRYHLSNFIELHHLWDDFSNALGNMDLFPQIVEKELDIVDWMTQSPNFSISVFYSMLSNLNLLVEFRSYMFNQRDQYHQECCDCGYPLIVPQSIQKKLLHHITWRTENIG